MPLFTLSPTSLKSLTTPHLRWNKNGRQYCSSPAIQFWDRCQFRRGKESRAWIYFSASGCIGMERSKDLWPANCHNYKLFLTAFFHLLHIYLVLNLEILRNKGLILTFIIHLYDLLHKKNITRTSSKHHINWIGSVKLLKHPKNYEETPFKLKRSTQIIRCGGLLSIKERKIIWEKFGQQTK